MVSAAFLCGVKLWYIRNRKDVHAHTHTHTHAHTHTRPSHCHTVTDMIKYFLTLYDPMVEERQQPTKPGLREVMEDDPREIFIRAALK